MSTPLRVEALEDRALPSGITISGFVFHDSDNDGIFQSSETPIANNPIELHNAQGAVVASTTTDANGFYQFNADSTIDQTPLTLTKTVTFASAPTDFNLQGMLDQFDPSLGALQEIDITHAGSITSDIKVENTSTSSGSVINGTVSGDLTLQAPGGVNDKLSLSQYAGTFTARAFDGQIDFQGDSGSDFGQKTANGSNQIVLTGSAITPYVGTGQVQLTETGHATSTAEGGGNLVVNVLSTGQSSITVVYKYIPSNAIKPGNYTIVETQEPPGFFPGKNSSNGTVLNTALGAEVIPVTITTGDSTNNDFGKLKGSSLSGTVYFDANNHGILETGDPGISGVTLTVTGTDVTGIAVSQTTTTAADGTYKFTPLRQGTYTITETPPAGYIDGQISVGSAGGAVGTEQVSNITLPSDTDAARYDFGHLKGASLSGFVYQDVHNDGKMDSGDPGIAGSTLTLTGTDDQGHAVSKRATTDANGAYTFGLRAGTYTITQDEPAGFVDGTDSAGTLGGTVGHDVISAITVAMGDAGEKYNFGEKSPPAPPPSPQPLETPPLAISLSTLPIISKNQLMSRTDLRNLDPNVLGKMTLVSGVYQTLTGAAADPTTNLQLTQRLLTGATTPGQIVADAWASDAHRALQAQQLYQTYLGRTPTAPEQATVVQQLKAGATEQSQVVAILTSPAYQQLHPSTEQLAAALTQDILGKTLDPASEQSLVQSMDNQTLNDVVSSMLSSAEAVNRSVDRTFRAVLRRPVTSAELALWTPQIQAGAITTDTLVQRLLASNEFYQMAYNAVV
jgi:hypothetical protein